MYIYICYDLKCEIKILQNVRSHTCKSFKKSN